VNQEILDDLEPPVPKDPKETLVREAELVSVEPKASKEHRDHKDQLEHVERRDLGEHLVIQESREQLVE